MSTDLLISSFFIPGSSLQETKFEFLCEALLKYGNWAHWSGEIIPISSKYEDSGEEKDCSYTR